MGVSLVFYAASHEEHMIDDCYNCYITKNNSVYFVDDASHPYKIEIADYISFTVLSQFYAKDKNNIYFFEDILENVDKDTFSALSGFYAKDDKHIYFGDKIFQNVDFDSFKALNIFYAKDKNSVYIYNKKLKVQLRKVFTLFPVYMPKTQIMCILKELLLIKQMLQALKHWIFHMQRIKKMCTI